MEDTLDSQIQTIKKWLGTGSINIFGPPFSGKDSQGKRLSSILDATLLGGGDILRNSVIPDDIRKMVDAGQLAPIDEYLRIVLPYLSRAEFAGKPLVFSAVGRWHGEEPGVLEATSQSGHNMKAVVFLDISEQTIRDRWHAQDASAGNDRGSRRDDNAQALETRLKEFNTKTLPVIDFYKNAGLLIEINGEPSANEVFKSIIRELSKFAVR